MARQVSLRVVHWLIVLTAIALVSTRAFAQESVTITGRVTSAEEGRPLAQASVTVPSLNIVAYVNDAGNYRLVIPAARAQGQSVTILARMIGKRTQSAVVTLSSGATLQRNFQLATDPLRLEEVVVTGAGTQTLAERLGTARATVSAATIQRTNETNVVTALAGKIPNVVTNQGSGDAGASTAIQIRGVKSISGSSPLIIIDGVPTNNATRAGATLGGSGLGAPVPNRAADINPEDIESIEILKGAAATSIYGASAGSAGAILITTKRGRAGQTTYTVHSTYQADKPVKFIPVQRMYGVGSGGVSSQCFTLNCTIAANFFSWGPKLAPTVDTYDHAREVYETGKIWDNTVAMSGGSDRTSFYLSAGSLSQDGFITGNKDFLHRYTVRFNGSHSLTEKLTFGASGSYVQTKGGGEDRGNSTNGVGIGALRQPPDFNARLYLDPVSGLARSWRFPNPGPTAFTNNRGFDDPFYAINQDQLTSETGRYYGNVNANWTPLHWLTVTETLGADYNNDDRTFGLARSSAGTTGGSLERWTYYDRIIDNNLIATGKWQPLSRMETSLSIGQNLDETFFRQVDVTGLTLIAPTPFKLSNTTTRTVPSDAETRRRIQGYFGQWTGDFYDQLFLSARLRNDGNSALGIGHQRAWYPGWSAAWSFTKALHLPESVVKFGKARVAYGESGQQPPLYSTQDIFTTSSFADFNPGSLQVPTLNGIGGLYPSAGRGNKDIKPERVRETEAGVDLNLFNGISDLSVTNYSSRSSDVVFGVSLPATTGYTSVSLNAGALTNKGWEVSTSLRPITRQDFAVEFSANWARNRNLVTSLGAIDAQLQGKVPMPTPANCGPEAKVPRCVTGVGSSFSGQSTAAQVGYPFGIWRSTDFARCGRGLTTIGPDNIAAACTGAPDGALYIAASGFPITDGTERAIGNPSPNWTGGFSADVTIKGVQLSAFLDHRSGGDVLNMTRSSMYQYGTHKDTELRGTTVTFGKNMLCHNKTCNVLNGPVVGPGANTPVVLGEAWFTGLGATGGPITTRLEDATFTRLREISIGYTFRNGLVGMMGGSRALDVKLSGRNLRLWAKYSGLDPETNIGGAANSNRGIDWFGTPLDRAVVVSFALHH